MSSHFQVLIIIFDFHGTSEALRLRIVSFHLEGRASAWYQWMKANDLLTSWKDFLQNLKFRFGASLYEDHQGNLSKLTQKSSVAEFQTKFENLMNKVTGISEPLLISFFITGLRVDIRRELLLSRPSSLMEAFALARMFEARGDESKVTSRPWSKWTHKTTTPSFHPTTTNHSPASAPAINPPQPAPSTLPPLLPTPSLPIKRLSPQELREKREKGLCYNCDQKWSNSHRCRSKFLLLLGTEDVDEAMGPPINSEISDVVEETIITGDISSLNALAGQNTPRSLRLLGEINQQPVQVLIDSGSTHNFIKPAVAEVLGLAVQDTTTFRVYIGNGDSLVCRYVCSQVALSMQGHVFYIDLYVLPIEGPDIVLGIQWLQLLGKVSHDYAALSMEFFYNGSHVFLRGDLSLSPRPISFHQLQALMSHDQIHGLFEFFQLHTTTDAQDTLSVPTTAAKFDFPPDLPSPVLALLHQYEQLFHTPSSLPPHRLIDHHIHLLPNTKPVNVRPYRYPHFQKAEMERLITEMLDQGIIRPSQSPFSSPVLLVKKKDGSYRFCVDYRALNAVTIKDKFPIPTIDELLDELGGACIFNNIEYLGHIVSSSGVKADPHKLVVMSNWPTPSTTKQLRGFLGLTGYYRRFIKGYASIAAPLTDLLRKDCFHWSSAADTAFAALKQAMSAAPVLRLPDFQLDFVIETDASNVGIGAVLMQADHPIAYFSRKLGPRMLVASTYIKELHAIAEAVHKWRQYLLGHFFIIRTDQKSIRELLQQVIQTPEQQFYVRKLLGYHFRVEYKPGRTNSAADALSRVHEVDVPELYDHYPATMLLASCPIPEFLSILRAENQSLPDLLALHQKYSSGSVMYPYSVSDGILRFKNRFFISSHSVLKPSLLQEFHATPVAGHAGVKRTLVRLSTLFYWPNMRKDVELFVASCLLCQQTKYSTQAPAGLLQPLPIPSLVWEEVTMDFITGLPFSHGFTVILVVVDRLTKSAHFGALPTHFTASKTAVLFTDMVVKHHGFPRTIISDRDSIFLSSFWKKLFELSGTTLKHSTAYHPQTDGQSEVVNRGLEQYLRVFTQAKPTLWFDYLGWAEFSYNTSFHTSIQMSPFKALYGREPPVIPAYTGSSTSIQALDELLLERDALLTALKTNLRAAQHRMQQKANAHRRELELQVGDQVLVKLQPYRQISVANRLSNKLAKRYYGPFRVTERIGAVAYRLDLPPDSKIHPVFHISLLKPFHGQDASQVHSLPSESYNNQPMSIPIAICAQRQVLVHGIPQSQILVQWQDCAPENATWEALSEFTKQYPNFHLEDKVIPQGVEGDTTPILQLDKPNSASSINSEEKAQANSSEAIQNRPQDNIKPSRVRKPPKWFKDYTH
ncbi:hypothetical protein KPL70_024860 [Citrus sinensis]|nr:hypothetical protein KPL70_024860 [Citrus sinensis]